MIAICLCLWRIIWSVKNWSKKKPVNIDIPFFVKGTRDSMKDKQLSNKTVYVSRNSINFKNVQKAHRQVRVALVENK